MKSLMIGAATALALMVAPAFAADSGSISGSPAANSAGSTTNSNQANPPCTDNNQLGCGSMGGVDGNSAGTSGSSTDSGSMAGSGSSSATDGTGGNSLGNSGSMGTGSDGPIGTQQPSGSMGGTSSTGNGGTVR
ncbi:hypothetical protein F1643_18840 [Azospirillum sp. INR13]|uniref:hypothetical protein n=1 Tax=Azospirillum sp. INR13 TaxID=2596919 RepID=UPI0018927BDB|nr:hypothetical protein [Azospirillum sp. INR13]MBF5096126.1 hypothetical protein [Azospirillum sp. INR13]